VPLAVTVILSIFTLTACKTNNKGTPTDSKSVSSTTTVTTSLATQVPTTEPFVLEGAITTKSGLQYLDILTGEGSVPETGNIVKMHYIVSLPDGTIIYTTHSSDKPEVVVWGRSELLPGWEEGVAMMKAGGKAKLVLPPELALGAEGSGNVPPNSQIIMEIELVSVELAPAPPSVAVDKLLSMESGEQYADLILGEGAEAISNTTVTTEFTIWVKGDSSNDFVFSSKDSQPVTFVVGKGDTVFSGWDQGVIGMKVGGTRLLIIPPDLALGSQSSSSIPANSTLIMEITLTDVKEVRAATKVDENDYITITGGLKYYDIQAGTGVTPTIGQTVVVNYVGWLEDGTQFDSSYDRGETFSFVLGAGDVISGWDLGIASMKVGCIRQLVIPSELGYGDSGAGSAIPPGATLIFEVELVEIKP